MRRPKRNITFEFRRLLYRIYWPLYKAKNVAHFINHFERKKKRARSIQAEAVDEMESKIVEWGLTSQLSRIPEKAVLAYCQIKIGIGFSLVVCTYPRSTLSFLFHLPFLLFQSFFPSHTDPLNLLCFSLGYGCSRTSEYKFNWSTTREPFLSDEYFLAACFYT